MAGRPAARPAPTTTAALGNHLLSRAGSRVGSGKGPARASFNGRDGGTSIPIRALALTPEGGRSQLSGTVNGITEWQLARTWRRRGRAPQRAQRGSLAPTDAL